MSADDGFNLLNAPQESGETAGDKEIHDKMNLEAVNNPPLLLNAHLQDLCKDEEVQEMKLQKAVEKLELDSDTNSLEAKIIKPPIKWQDVPVLNISGPGKPITVTEWAEVIDESEPVPDFQEKIQNMALTYPFELDNFQKQAILKLEEGYHVLVAAHTSAGKTVVAEYAIAMSRKNNTRTIYTSPIKALSNQKYNDFKKMFGEVGLLTGDLQINVTAPVLVMTTEILRSKLYFSDEVTRDLEFVIIDEVHYINHAERGYVWEEVLILLPAHVSIVMLSSTVPNTLQFADWLGRTKNRKVYVVSTPKRPVPLCHFLYTGMGEKTMNKSFLVVDQEDKFHLDGYNKAVASKTKREFDNSMCLFPPDCHSDNEAEQRMWISLVKHLKQQDKLPVISFTLARNRCDQIAKSLLSLNLTNRKEKVQIRNFFRKCLLRLTRADRLLPQVTNLRKLLIYGIGVHHSGILPLLKEIVEMLFQSGFVKILFATETFAMGVNMPARTVVFNDIIKFDGQQRRLLSPTEYIQMAGRAGRRGIDETGTVIIVCKKFVPDLETLKNLVLGVPQELSSQFRLTYTMILGLLRASTVTVEAMMRRSFRESHQIRQVDNYKVQLKRAEKNHVEKFSTPLACHLAPLALFYDAAAAYINASDRMIPLIFNDEKVEEEMVPGKVLVISSGPYMNKIAVLLYNFGRRKEKKYKVLVLKTNDRENAITNLEDQTWCRMLSFSALFDYIGTEKKTLEHNIISVAPKNIVAITKIKLEFDATVIIGDWERRQLERFKDVPIGVSCLRVVKKLSRISYDVYWGLSRLEYINFTQLLTNTDENYLIWLDEVETCKAEIKEYRDLTDIPTFEEDFAIVYERKVTESKLKKYTKLLAFENLTLYPEYQRRLNVLRELHYIDEDDNIILKGQVACCMGTNELIITELIWRQVFTDKTPAEIAALLSCFVLQTKVQDRNKLWESLLEGRRDIEDIDAELTAIESRHLVGQFRSNPERLNFGLMKLVHEWVQEQPFLDVMYYVRLQEGIVVRCIQQLHELLIDVKDAAVVLGDTNLEAKMVVATTAIRRGIVFASSLYTIQDETLNPLE